MDIRSKFSFIKKKNLETSGSELADDVLRIDCRECKSVPDVRSQGCIKCIISHISQQGNAERVRLRTSRDLELFGPAVDILCETAMVYRSMKPRYEKDQKKTCSDCNNSLQKVMAIAESGFPDPNFDSARGRLGSFHASERECNSCIQKTYRALDQIELGIKNLKNKASVEAARKGDV